MESRSYKFDKNFFIEQLGEAKEKLDTVTNEEEKNDIIDMIDLCDIIINNRLKEEKIASENKTFSEKCKNIENKLNYYLNKIDLKTWQCFIYLNYMIDKTKFKEVKYNNINISLEEMMELILDFYEQLDTDYYHKALQIIQSPTPLINVDENTKRPNQCNYCEYLKAPLINVKETSDEKYLVLVHELQHGIDYLLLGNKPSYLFSELAPIFFEIIFADILNGINPCEGLYSIRINDQVRMIETLNEFASILLEFDKNDRKITEDNVYSILNVKPAQFDKRYETIMNRKYIDYCKYSLSLLKALGIRYMYYNGFQKDAVKELKQYVSGEKCEMNFNILVGFYNEYVEEVLSRQKDQYVK